MNNYINDELVKADVMHGINIDDIIKAATDEIRSIYKTADEINRSSVDITDVDEGTELNNATDMLEEFLNDRKEYKRKLTAKKNVVCGLIERKMVTVFNHDKLVIGAPYDITFIGDTVITEYDGTSFMFKGGTTHTGIFFKGGETFLSFTLIGPGHFPIIAKLKPDMLFYIQEYNNHNET